MYQNINNYMYVVLYEPEIRANPHIPGVVSVLLRTMCFIGKSFAVLTADKLAL